MPEDVGDPGFGEVLVPGEDPGAQAAGVLLTVTGVLALQLGG
ncbi:hypothetical protein H4W79_003731 [Nocardiopsis terrae]|uniref:Uncharacterized protein n=1 Tax=Nocardiopsis terrae TaxID=372655 RepID=A0ABR9HKG7_9ACTN|nr:hypothetical protein [Nocardiopsis terrae]MBE1459517.1 hypothetical protein [Nocardiopsis terrae]